MTARHYYILKKLGVDTENTDDAIFEQLLDLANYLYDELKQEEKDRFANEIKRLIIKPSN